MARGIGLRFIGRFANEGINIVTNMAKGNVVGATIDACCQTIGLIDSVIRYSGESKRTGEIEKQLKYKRDELDKGIEYIEESLESKLILLKEKIHERYLNEKLTLSNELEVYKREVSVINLGVNNSFTEEKKIQQMTNKFCGRLNNILDDIEFRINEIDKSEGDKTNVYILQEDFRVVQRQLIKILKQ